MEKLSKEDQKIFDDIDKSLDRLDYKADEFNLLMDWMAGSILLTLAACVYLKWG